MKGIFNIFALIFLIMTASSQCFALRENAEVSPEQAKEWGIRIRSQTFSTNQIGVWLEFKRTGKLEAFSHVELEITAGEKNLVSAPLLATSDGGNTTVHFSVDPAYLPASRLKIVVRPRERTIIGYQLNVKDFIDREPSR
jgi:hypothetical protein